jgi:hypothetical protein
MTQKIAVAVVHGVGSQKADFAKRLAEELKQRFAHELGDEVPNAEDELQIRGVYWAEVLADRESALEDRTEPIGRLQWDELRNIFIDLGGDAIAYQPGESGQNDCYVEIHKTFAGTLKYLAAEAGPDAPLCMISHSLGTVIASNYVYDLQEDITPKEVADMGTGTPLEAGKTLSLFYTMGSPIAVWSLRFEDFGKPIKFPPPDLAGPALAPAEWVNIFDRDDIIAYPLRGLNDGYAGTVNEDLQINVGNLFMSWTPLIHTRYWTDRSVVERVTDGLVRTWKAVNSA